MVGDEWITRFYVATSSEQVTEDNITLFLDAIEQHLYADRAAFDASLKDVDPGLLAPEFSVGLARALYPARDALVHWSGYVERLRVHLAAEQPEAVAELLQGLVS